MLEGGVSAALLCAALRCVLRVLLVWALTFLQSLDLLLRKAGPVPLQLPLELQPQLRLLALVPLHGDASHLAWPAGARLSTHAALGVQQAALGHWKR